MISTDKESFERGLMIVASVGPIVEYAVIHMESGRAFEAAGILQKALEYYSEAERLYLVAEQMCRDISEKPLPSKSELFRDLITTAHLDED